MYSDLDLRDVSQLIVTRIGVTIGSLLFHVLEKYFSSSFFVGVPGVVVAISLSVAAGKDGIQSYVSNK